MAALGHDSSVSRVGNGGRLRQGTGWPGFERVLQPAVLRSIPVTTLRDGGVRDVSSCQPPATEGYGPESSEPPMEHRKTTEEH